LRISSEHILYLGFKGMTRKLYESENELPMYRPPKSAEEILLQGKPISIRSYNLASNLIAKVFFTLVYKKDSLSKSSVEDMAEAFVAQQKELNSKNFVPDILTILTALNMIEKNESTESISYIGPDLRIYDENNRKISWKIYEIMKREDAAIGKESQGIVNSEVKVENSRYQHSGNVVVNPYHISYFPELSYAVLRFNNNQ
jgi:hypothetical protein